MNEMEIMKKPKITTTLVLRMFECIGGYQWYVDEEMKKPCTQRDMRRKLCKICYIAKIKQ